MPSEPRPESNRAAIRFLAAVSVWLSIAVLVWSCEYDFAIKADPLDALLVINGLSYTGPVAYRSETSEIVVEAQSPGYHPASFTFTNPSPFQAVDCAVALEPIVFNVGINVIDGMSEVFVDGTAWGVTPVAAVLRWGRHELTLKRAGYPDERCFLDARRDTELTFVHHPTPRSLELPIEQLGIFRTGRQPKQVVFSPDSRSVFIPLLDDTGFQVFDLESLSMRATIEVPEYGGSKGFAEGLFTADGRRFLVSQMTTGKLFEFDADDFSPLRTIDAYGVWSKYLAKSVALGVVAVSNWLSNSISVIDYESGELKAKIKTEPEPRGLVFDSQGRQLYATTYLGGTVLKIDTASWQTVGRIARTNAAAMRHAIITSDDKTLYVSDMHNAEVCEVDLATFAVTASFKVDNNPNTIAFTPDERYIFVSCRGPNDPVSYLNRSPRNGRIHVIDRNDRTVAWFEGGNQPTGLDISPDGRYLCFSNFKDDTIELYRIDALPGR